ncbi:MAG TPA: MarR family transcriptional regulator [Candidatus Saccharimonadales bacterium]|nr:MarR family transcriptional regulator [Candidatus Saccharimonadales bacterium]
MGTRDETLQKMFSNMEATKRLMGSHFQYALRELGISRAQAMLLFTIDAQQPISFKQVAEHVMLTPGAVTQGINSLDALGYITRQPDEHDRRIIYLGLTPGGKTFVKRLHTIHHKMVADIMTEMSDQEVAIWLSVQEKMLHYLKTHAPKEKEEDK